MFRFGAIDSRSMIQQMAQIILDRTLSTRDKSIIAKIERRVLMYARRGLIGADPLVTYRLGRFELRVPTSHNLPYHQMGLPDYSMNIGRLSRCVKEKYPDLHFIDVGANVGDTAAVVRDLSHFPILCIEGDERFFEILTMNASVLGTDLHLVKAFVGPGTSVAASVLRQGGTARIEPGGSQTIYTERLTEILANHPEFRRSKILKIDTDGFDVEVLRSSLDWVSEARPILFFEYDPYLLEQSGTKDPISMFQQLRAAGYRSAIVYENVGDYVMTLPLDNTSLVEDVHDYFRGRAGKRYADICAFHEVDDELCAQVRQNEMEHFKIRRA
jgi:FkbM family methyltransferase